MTFVVAGSFASIARNLRQPWPGAALLAVAVLALLLGAVLGADARLLPLATVIGVPAGLLMWLARKHVQPLSTATELGRPYLVLALAGLPLWLCM